MNEYVIAEYIRLSVDDGITESLSIPSQRKIITQYINGLDISNVKILEFVDNGYTGTMMERPALQEMLDLASNGGIDCVIIKDLSRLSRNAPESSYLIERVFPFYRIRFISISDNYDSGDYKETTGGLSISFKYIIHEHYSQDLSKKVKSSKRYKMEHGLSIVAGAIYGYRKNDEGKWEPDSISSNVVQEIYGMAIKGFATSQIRDVLYANRYPTPREHIEMRRGKDVAPECMWTARMVLHILTNEQYTGTYVSGKQESKKVGSHSKNRVDKSKWIIIPDKHPAIVSKADFASVQDLLKYRKGSITRKPLKSDMSHPKRARMLSGEFISTTPIYGYKKTVNGNWEIDESAEPVIQKIYEMASDGSSYAEICSELLKLGYPTPSEYIKLAKGQEIMPTNIWTVECVRGILKNEQYTGAYVSGKILKDYETGKSYHTPKNEWIVVPNKHPAIISKEIFDKVQEKARKKRPRNYLLRGLTACGCCGYALAYDNSAGGTYRCHHTLVNPDAKCHKMKVIVFELDNAVLSLIKQQAEVILDGGGTFQMMNAKDIERSHSEYNNQRIEAEKQMKEHYENYRAGKIEQEQYSALMAECTKKIEMLNNQLSILKKAERDKRAKKKTSDIAKEALNESVISREIIPKLIEKIRIFPDNQIVIDWKIADFSSL